MKHLSQRKKNPVLGDANNRNSTRRNLPANIQADVMVSENGTGPDSMVNKV